MDPLRAELLDRFSGIRGVRTPTPLYSAVLAEPVPGDRLDADHWYANLREPVRFADTIRRMLDDGYRYFVELSPHPRSPRRSRRWRRRPGSTRSASARCAGRATDTTYCCAGWGVVHGRAHARLAAAVPAGTPGRPADLRLRPRTPLARARPGHRLGRRISAPGHAPGGQRRTRPAPLPGRHRPRRQPLRLSHRPSGHR